MKCRVGDLAIVVAAKNRSNLGLIVRIVAPHDGSGRIVFDESDHAWLVDSPQVMMWSIGKEKIFGKSGPVPDCQLQPIRAKRLDERSEMATCTEILSEEKA